MFDAPISHELAHAGDHGRVKSLRSGAQGWRTPQPCRRSAQPYFSRSSNSGGAQGHRLLWPFGPRFFDAIKFADDDGEFGLDFGHAFLADGHGDAPRLGCSHRTCYRERIASHKCPMGYCILLETRHPPPVPWDNGKRRHDIDNRCWFERQPEARANQPPSPGLTHTPTPRPGLFSPTTRDARYARRFKKVSSLHF